MSSNQWEVLSQQPMQRAVSGATGLKFGPEWDAVDHAPMTGADYSALKQRDQPGSSSDNAVSGVTQSALHEVSGFIANTVGAYMKAGAAAGVPAGLPDKGQSTQDYLRQQVQQTVTPEGRSAAVDAANKKIEDAVGKAVYQPRTPKGKQYTHDVEVPLSKWNELAQNAGQQVAQKTGSQFAGKATSVALQNAPYIVLPELGVRVVKKFAGGKAGAANDTTNLGDEFWSNPLGKGELPPAGEKPTNAEQSPPGDGSSGMPQLPPPQSADAWQGKTVKVDGIEGDWKVTGKTDPNVVQLQNLQTGEKREAGVDLLKSPPAPIEAPKFVGDQEGNVARQSDYQSPGVDTGLTPDVVRAQQARAQSKPPAAVAQTQALPAPAFEANTQGVASRPGDQMRAQGAETQRKAQLGLTPDVERAQAAKNASVNATPTVIDTNKLDQVRNFVGKAVDKVLNPAKKQALSDVHATLNRARGNFEAGETDTAVNQLHKAADAIRGSYPGISQTIDEVHKAPVEQASPEPNLSHQLAPSAQTRAIGDVFHRYAGLGHDEIPVHEAASDLPQVMGFSSPFPIVKGHDMKPDVPAQYDLKRREIQVNPDFTAPRGLAAQYLAEEVLHGIDAVTSNRTLSAGSPLFADNGPIQKEIDQAIKQNPRLADFLYYPLHPRFGLTKSRIKAELFARLGALYLGDPGFLHETVPTAHGVFHELFALDTSPLPDTSGDSVFGKVWSSVGKPGQVRGEHGTGGRPGGGLPKSAGDWTPADQRRMAPIRQAAAKALDTNALGARVQLGSHLETRAHDPDTEDSLRKAGLGKNKGIASTLDIFKQVSARDLANLSAEAKDEAIQGFLDRFHGLKRLENRVAGALPAEQSPYVATRFSTGSGTVLAAVLTHGAPEWRDGILRKKPGSKGLLEVLGPVKHDLRDWLGWMIGKRAERLKDEGRENLFNDVDIQRLKGLAKGKQATFMAVTKDFDALKKSILDVAQTAGLLDASTRPAWDNADYIPFYRLDGEQTKSPKAGGGLSGQSSGIKTLKGGTEALSDPLENIIRNFSKLIDASMKNHAIRMAADLLEPHGYLEKVPLQMQPELIPMSEVRRVLKQEGINTSMIDLGSLKAVQKMMSFKPPADPDVVRIMRDGKPVYYRVNDPLLLRSLTAVNANEMGGLLKPFRFFSRLLTGAVTATPDFQLRNFSRDALSAWVISEHHFIPVWDGVRGYKKSLMEQGGFEDMMFAGASFSGGHVSVHDPERTARLIRRALRAKGFSNSDIKAHMATIVDKPAKVWDMYRKLSEASENANREAVFEAVTKGGGSVAKGAYEAKDLMDFSMWGDYAFTQIIKSIVPFLNPRAQGLYKLVRAGAVPVPGMARGSAVVKGAIIAMASLALWYENKDNPKYQQLPDWDKDTYWHMFLLEEHFRFPKPFEVGTIYATIPERWADRMHGDINSSKLLDRLLWNTQQVLAFNPLPQAVRPVLDVYSNKDSFTGAPVENESDKNKLPSDRYNGSTSPTLVEAGKYVSNPTGLSPKQMQELVRGYTGSMGMYLLSMSDILVRHMEDAPDQPTSRADQYPVIKSFFRGSEPPAYTQYIEDLYNAREEINQIYGSVRSRQKEGDQQGAADLAKKDEKKLAARKYLNNAAKKMTKLRHQINEIEQSRVIKASSKRKQLDELYKDRADIARETMKAVGPLLD